MAAVERRTAATEIRVEGRRLTGTVMKYGDVSPSHRERFEPGSLRMAEAVHLDLDHDPERAVAWHPGGGLALAGGSDAITMRAELPPIPAADRALAEVRAGKVTGLSVEFRAVREGQFQLQNRSSGCFPRDTIGIVNPLAALNLTLEGRCFLWEMGWQMERDTSLERYEGRK